MSTEVMAGQLGMATPYHDLVGKSDAELQAEFADYAALGVSWIRTDFYWGMIQPTKIGAYNWAKLDLIVDTAAKYGIEVIGLLCGKPAWTSAGFASADDAVAFGAFAAALAERYKDKVDYWEILNETNINGIPAANYTRMLKAAYSAIKAVDPTDFVITGGLSPVPTSTNGMWSAVSYLQEMYAAGAKGYFDAIGFHPYGWPLLPEDPKSWNGWQIMEDGIRQTMIANGQEKVKVWITEIGAPTSGSSSSLTAAQQLAVLEQAIKLAGSSSWAGPVLWYSYQDKGTSATDTESWYGLIGPNGEKKPAYYLYQQLATHDDAILVAEVNFGTVAYFGNGADNVILGGDLDNILKGAGGNDTIEGGGGDDLIHGGSGYDVLLGGAGDDTLNGGAGNDILIGGDGNDVFQFSNDPWGDTILDFTTGDLIDLTTMDANTTVAGTQTFTFIGSAAMSKAGDLGVYFDMANKMTHVKADLNGDGKGDIDIALKGILNLTARDFRLTPVDPAPTFKLSANHTGTSGNDVLIGNAKANVISGLAGNDVIHGGAGDDVLVGHKGDDILWGGEGADRFDFNDARFFGTDIIMDFERGIDRIDLSGADANERLAGNQDFTFVGNAPLSRAGDLGVYLDADRGVTLVKGDTDGDGRHDFIIVLDGVKALSATDFIL